MENPSIQLSLQLQQLHVCFLLVETNWISHSCLPCWGLPETSAQKLCSIPRFLFPHPEEQKIGQICSLSDPFHFLFTSHLESSCFLVFWQNLMEPIQIPPEVYGRKITKLWRTVVRGSDQMCSLFSLQPKVSHMSQALEGQWTKTSDWQGKEGWLVLDTVGDTRAWGMFLNSASCISLALVFMRGSVQIGCSARLAQRSALVVSLRQ